MAEGVSISTNEATPAVTTFILQLQFTIDTKVTSAKNGIPNYPAARLQKTFN